MESRLPDLVQTIAVGLTAFWLAVPVLALLGRRRAAIILDAAVALAALVWGITIAADSTLDAIGVAIFIGLPFVSLVGSALARRGRRYVGALAWLAIAPAIYWSIFLAFCIVMMLPINKPVPPLCSLLFPR